jgi:hypothetical protein
MNVAVLDFFVRSVGVGGVFLRLSPWGFPWR